MKIILTRPLGDSLITKPKLVQLGHSVALCPLLHILPSPDIFIQQNNYQAIIATSANALKILVPPPWLQKIPLYTVGPYSQKAGEEKGFHSVTAAGGNVAGLCDYLKTILHKDHGPILYLAGAEVSADLKKIMEQSGYSVEKLILYEAVAQAPENLAASLQVAQAVMLYSPRSAKIWLQNLHHQNLLNEAENLWHFCLSPAVASILPAAWPKFIAKTPDEPALIEQVALAGMKI